MTGADTQDELLPRMTRYLDYFQALTDVAKTITSSLKLDDVIDHIMTSVSKLMLPNNWSLLLLDVEKQELYFELVVGEAADAIKHLRLPVGEGIAGWVAKHRKPAVVSKVSEDPRFSNRMDDASDFQTASVVCVPLIFQDELLGVLELVKDKNDPEPFTEADIEFLTPFSDFVAIAIANARAFEQVENLTVQDEWTRLYNARFLQSYLPQEVERARRYQYPLALIFFDLDNFKSINDTRGHSTGSRVLQEVGVLLRQMTREPDRPIRYGGDEFVVAAPHTSRESALEMAHRIQELMASHHYEVLEGTSLTVTGSFGVATFPDDASDADGLLNAADRAMYLAKARGKNTIVDARELHAEKSEQQ